ncbi:MAG: hypothetical protein CMH91_10835 [Oceanicaulis sp.]|jgi:hypothetical protein|nr:hypothetical protein OA2633_13880 [Oceanicaulis alexandrii HTCC2633] [Oceanicaulis sp. HTCC2633]MAB70096.1 hypothetical protein [Oceanicaulis sp.]MBC39540.1 hypothetical protein [Oceanicaulis sp.]MBG35835.1 hypothetical protein [Oceanicaulis sp.]HBU62244.1 hypothetical protein [Oceanicaulis sp.]|tara:strand:- start:5380 stop:5640 length:261 start_codon:yes stop_codon:yes gene_type:complete
MGMRFVYQTLGFLLIAVGVPLFWTPLPFGLVLIAIGMALVLSNSDSAREWVRGKRQDHPGFNDLMTKAERVTPHPFDRILQRTEIN